METNKIQLKEKIKKTLESKTAAKILYGLGIAIVLMCTFHAGVITGFQKASYGHAWGQHYSENFGIGNIDRDDVSLGGMMNNFGMMDYFPNAHGATGKVIKITLPNLIVKDDDNMERIISTDANTLIQKGRTTLQANELGLDDFIVVIGTPDDKGLIEAKLIRVIPAPQFLEQ